jgi:hypothetical protein
MRKHPNVKPKPKDATTQAAVRFPTELYERLKEAGGERGMSEEIRRRLDASFEPTAGDPKTRELLEVITKLAGEFAAEGTPWSENKFGWEAFRIAVAEVLNHFDPGKGDYVGGGALPQSSYFYALEMTPEQAGTLIAHQVMRGK